VAFYNIHPMENTWQQAGTIAATVANAGERQLSATLASGGASYEPTWHVPDEYIPGGKRRKAAQPLTAEQEEARARARYG
jgi:hypothetical protein